MKWLICFLCVLSSLTCLSNEKLSLEECINLIEAGRGAEAQKSLQVLFSEQAEAELWNEDRFATAFMLLSNVYSSEGQLRKVSDLCREALKVFNQKSKVANTEFSRQLWRLSGAVQVELKDYDNAIRYLQQSQWMYEDESIYDMGYFTVLTLLGGCYLQKSDFVTAKLYIDEAEEVHNTYLGRITDSKFIDSYSLLNYKGLLLQALGKSSSAENCFKSYIYKEVTPYALLMSGGQGTVAKLFVNNTTGRVGSVGEWDAICFDESTDHLFKDSDAVPLMKDYMESGSFSRGGKGGEISGNASIIYNGNINQPVETVLQNSHLFSPMSTEVNNDTAFLDRINAYLPGWEIKKFAPSNFTTHFGFSTDFFSEFLKALRKDTYYEAIDTYFSLGNHLKQRDAKSVRRIVSGYIKLLHPDGNYSREDLDEEALYTQKQCVVQI